MMTACSLLMATLAIVPQPQAFRISGRTLPAEGYRIRIDAAGKAEVEAADEAGRYYANVTLGQLKGAKGPLEIEDWPRYSWRGVMLDESRFFFGKETVKAVLDEMARHKLNVFHWHLTDDQGWRLDVPGLPEIARKGAVRAHSWKPFTEDESDGTPYGPHFYTADDIREVVAHARARHIRVVPEIELPGHVSALLASHPEFSCEGVLQPAKMPKCEVGISDIVLCAGNDEAIRFMERVLDEVTKLFPDGCVHIGGDECPKAKWKACAKCQARMKALGLKDENALQAWLTRHFVGYLKSKGRRVVGWDEILEGGELDPSAIVQCWRPAGWAGTGGTVAETPGGVAVGRGHDIIVSPVDVTYFSVPWAKDGNRICWRRPLADYGEPELVSLEKVYQFDPAAGIDPKLCGRVLGSESCNWTEGTRDYATLRAKMWPRTAALAEVLWTGPNRGGFEDFVRRISRTKSRDHVQPLSLNGSWEFRFEEGKSCATAGDATFAATGTMAVPGCYDLMPQQLLKRGTGLYRRTFTLEKPVENAWLVVDGMGLTGRFAVDGRDLGTHPYPYARLELETGPLAAGTHTVFAALDNVFDWSVQKLARPYYDFYLYGGFYHGVSLVFDSRKLFVRTCDIRTGEVEIQVEGEEAVGDRTVVFDGTNAVKATFVKNRARVKVPGFRLWSPEHPHLHSVAFDSRLQTRFGIRTIEARNRRLWLNGRPIYLKGINRHEAHPGFGAATPEALMLQDIQNVKALGGNFIRCAHYQQTLRFLDFCDENGVLVWEESFGWGNGSHSAMAAGELTDEGFIAAQLYQTREMVRTSFNHPSIVVYAFMNEFLSSSKDGKALADRLIDTIRAENTGRLVTFACCQNGRDIANERTDFVAFNTYPAWIDNSDPGDAATLRRLIAEDVVKWTKDYRAKHPDKPIIVSEMGTCAAWGHHDPTAAQWTEDFQAEYIGDVIDAVFANEDICGLLIWQLADTRSFFRAGGVRTKPFAENLAGIFDGFRRPKMAVDVVRKKFSAKATEDGR